MKKTFILVLIVACLILPLVGCTSKIENFAFGTYYSVEIKGGTASSKNLEDKVRELELKLSTNVENSDIDKINKATANEEVAVSSYTIELFKIAKRLYVDTNGTFNPAVFPLVELWNFSPENYTGVANSIPSSEEIARLLPYCDFNLFELNVENKTIVKKETMAKLDFGAIAKGYCADVIYEDVKDANSAIIDVGATYRIIGEIPLYVLDPRKDNFVAKATISNCSISTSGDYERCYFVDGVRYHHILDKNGYPAGLGDENAIISATVVGNDATICDALSTATMILDYEKSKNLIESYGYSALLLTESGYYTIGDNIFEIQDARQKLN